MLKQTFVFFLGLLFLIAVSRIAFAFEDLSAEGLKVNEHYFIEKEGQALIIHHGNNSKIILKQDGTLSPTVGGMGVVFPLYLHFGADRFAIFSSEGREVETLDQSGGLRLKTFVSMNYFWNQNAESSVLRSIGNEIVVSKKLLRIDSDLNVTVPYKRTYHFIDSNRHSSDKTLTPVRHD